MRLSSSSSIAFSVAASEEDKYRLTSLALNPKWYYYVAKVIDLPAEPTYIGDLAQRLETADFCVNPFNQTGRLEDDSSKLFNREPTIDNVTLLILEIMIVEVKSPFYQIWKKTPDEIEKISKVIGQMEADHKRRRRERMKLK